MKKKTFSLFLIHIIEKEDFIKKTKLIKNLHIKNYLIKKQKCFFLKVNFYYKKKS